jgi:hypothetical protein
MSLRDVDITSAIRRVADRRIEEAMREGKFDNLKGMGEPLQLDDMPADEDARAMWRALRILRSNDFTPDEVRWRKLIENLKIRLNATTNPLLRGKLVAQINTLVLKLNTLGTNAINLPVTGVSEE